MEFVRGKEQIALPFATTGIASTLLKGGRTVHSGFKLPVPLLDTSVSSMRINSPEAELLRKASIIIIHEITMMPKHGLRCIDKLLRELMRNDNQIGGKVFVIGGDFRQTLPVVVHETRTDIIEMCIKSSPLWKELTKLSLTTNMRSKGQDEHNNWLLQVGRGSFVKVPEFVNTELIEIPQSMTTNTDLIEGIFGSDILQLSIAELANRVRLSLIVAPTNA